MRHHRHRRPQGGPVPPPLLSRMTNIIAHRGPDSVGRLHRRPGRPRPSPAGDHRPVAARPPADGERGRLASSSSSTARSTTTASSASSWSATATSFHSQTDTEVDRPRLRGVGRRRASSASTACSRSPSGTSPASGSSSPATATGSSRSTGTSRTALLAVRAPRSRRSSNTRPSREGVCYEALNEYFSFQNIFSDRTLFAGMRLLPAASTLTFDLRGPTTDSQALLGLSVPHAPLKGSKEELRRGAAPAVRAGGDPAAHERRAGRVVPVRRHGLRVDHVDRGAASAAADDLYRRVRPQLGLGPGARVRRAARPPR